MQSRLWLDYDSFRLQASGRLTPDEAFGEVVAQSDGQQPEPEA